MINWEYKEEFEPSDYFGFVYIITNIVDGRTYIGRKQFHSATRKPLTKKELESRTDKRSSKKKLVVVESNWQNYWSSCTELKNDVKEIGEEYFTKKILHLCKTRKQLSYWEIYYQFKYDVLRVDSYNENINGVFYKKDLE